MKVLLRIGKKKQKELEILLKLCLWVENWRLKWVKPGLALEWAISKIIVLSLSWNEVQALSWAYIHRPGKSNHSIQIQYLIKAAHFCGCWVNFKREETKIKWDKIWSIIWRRVPNRESTSWIHPFLCDFRIMPVYHIFQAFCCVHPLKPFLCICLLIEVAWKEPVCL